MKTFKTDPISPEVEALSEAKRALRQHMRAQRKRLEAAWVGRASEQVQAAVMALPEYRASRRVALYLAIVGEVRTDAVIQDCRANGREIFVPAESAGQYGLVALLDGAPLESGPLSVLQPCGGLVADAASMDLWVVPGLAFDASGGRLGQGGGHYDRMLAAAGIGVIVGVAFEFQMVESVPVGCQDRRMHVVTTNARTCRVERPGSAKGTRT